MKFLRYVTLILLVVLMALPAWGERKKVIKSAKAYLSSVKIHLAANPPRYDEALELIREVLDNHGPVPEAYFYKAAIFEGYANKSYDPAEKKEHIKDMVLYYDSVKIACANGDIDKKYKKDCKKYLKTADSTFTLFWRDVFNSGVEVLSRLDSRYLPELTSAPDSAARARAQTTIDAAVDTAKQYLEAATIVDPENYRSFEAVGIIYDRLQEHDSSAIWFNKALEMAPDSAAFSITQNIAYAYIQDRNWDKAIEYFKKFLEFAPDDANTMMNIAICYNNKQMYDSSFAYNLKATKLNPDDPGPFIDIGQYYLLRSQQNFSDSITYYQRDDQPEKAKEFIDQRDNLLDSAATYFGRGLALDSTNTIAIEQHAIIRLVLGEYEKAENGFKKLTEIEPGQKDHWINLGDTRIQMKKFDEAIEPFEKARKLDPENLGVLNTLNDLYKSNKMPEKAAEVSAKIEEIQSQ